MYNSGLQKHQAPVAQLDRVLGYEPRGRAFESLRARQTRTKLGTSSEVPIFFATIADFSAAQLPCIVAALPDTFCPTP